MCQAETVSACVREQWKNRILRVSPTVIFPGLVLVPRHSYSYVRTAKQKCVLSVLALKDCKGNQGKECLKDQRETLFSNCSFFYWHELANPKTSCQKCGNYIWLLYLKMLLCYRICAGWTMLFEVSGVAKYWWVQNGIFCEILSTWCHGISCMICMISILRLLGTRLHSNTCLSDLGYFPVCMGCKHDGGYGLCGDFRLFFCKLVVFFYYGRHVSEIRLGLD